MVDLYCFSIGCVSTPFIAVFKIMGCGQIIGGVSCETHADYARRQPRHHPHAGCGHVLIEFDIGEFRKLHPEAMTW